MFEPVDKSRAFERVVQQIESAIFSGALKPGDHLPSERALVEEFRVGRTTIREALRILESMGLLKTEPGSPKGPRVTPSNTVGLQRTLNAVAKLEQIQLADLVQYRMVAGSATNYLAAHLRSDEHLAQLKAAIDGMRAAKDDHALFASNDSIFHKVMAQAAGNTMLSVIGSVINQMIVDLVAETLDRSVQAGTVQRNFIALHENLFEAVRDREAERAGELAKTSLFDAYAPLLDPDEVARLKLLL